MKASAPLPGICAPLREDLVVVVVVVVVRTLTPNYLRQASPDRGKYRVNALHTRTYFPRSGEASLRCNSELLPPPPVHHHHRTTLFGLLDACIDSPFPFPDPVVLYLAPGLVRAR